MAGDQRIEIAVGIDIRETLLLRERRGGGERYQIVVSVSLRNMAAPFCRS
jgi:hypothetical protein